ncbi:hypothetical protein H2248_011993 [Termitomyces sp. 'cryptogamus']|nr:hypothetical protein H2248_011993 [Termitomyces sp. 'cryptogamus']
MDGVINKLKTLKEDSKKYDPKSTLVHTVGDLVNQTSQHTQGSSGSAVPPAPEKPKARGFPDSKSQSTVKTSQNVKTSQTGRPVKAGPNITRKHQEQSAQN